MKVSLIFVAAHPLRANPARVQVYVSIGNPHGLRTRVVVAGGGTNSSWITSRKPASSAPRSRSRVTFKSSAICGGVSLVCYHNLCLAIYANRHRVEFHLVAGGEELFQENGLLAHTNQKAGAGSADASSSNKAEAPDSCAGSSSSSSTPEHRASEFPSDIPASSPYPSVSPSQSSSFLDLGSDDMFAPSLSPPTTADVHFGVLPSSPSTTHPITPASVKLEPLAMDPTLFTLPQSAYSDSAADYALSIPNRISNLYFWADGMLPLSLDVDRLVGATPSLPSRIFLHFRVSMPPLADLRCPPNLQGINGALSLANRWTSIAKCQTKSWGPSRTLMSQDQGLFTQVTVPELQAGLNADPSSSQMVYAYLPDSALNRCHWLDTGEYKAYLGKRLSSKRNASAACYVNHTLTTCFFSAPFALSLCVHIALW